MPNHSEDHFVEADEHAEPEPHQPRLNEVAQKFLADLEEEKKRLDSEAFPLCAMLIDEAFDRVCTTGRIPGKEFYADVYKQKPMKVTQKVFVPTKQFPKFNFVGKLLGPKGNSLRRLQEETQCKIAIKGRNSRRDRAKEEELRNLNEPRYGHLNKDLYVEISTVATPAESYARVAYALAEIRKYLLPDKNDEVSHEQLRELMRIDPQNAQRVKSIMPHLNGSILEKSINNEAHGVEKYQNLIRHAAANPEEEDIEGSYEYHRGEKRPSYAYSKAPAPVQSTSPYKRPPASGYGTEIKRSRTAPMKSILKSTSYSILNKYTNQ